MTDAQTEARAIVSAILVDERLAVGYQIETLADAIVEHIATALAAKDAELAAERAALRLAADRADRAEADLERWKLQSDDWQKRGWELGKQLDQAEAQLAEARKALEPFAREADGWGADQNDGFVFHDTERLDGEHRLNVGHLLSALEPAAPEMKTLVHEPMVWTGRGPYGMSPAAPKGEQEAARIGDAVLAWMTKYDLLDGEQEYYVADVIAVLDDLTPLTRPAEQAVTKAGAVRREIKSEMEILRRLADGDQIAFSEDGDCAFFTGGDRAFVGPVIISMRSKSYLKRITLDDENYRGTAERDVISDAGIAALKAAMEASHD